MWESESSFKRDYCHLVTDHERANVVLGKEAGVGCVGVWTVHYHRRASNFRIHPLSISSEIRTLGRKWRTAAFLLFCSCFHYVVPCLAILLTLTWKRMCYRRLSAQLNTLRVACRVTMLLIRFYAETWNPDSGRHCSLDLRAVFDRNWFSNERVHVFRRQWDRSVDFYFYFFFRPLLEWTGVVRKRIEPPETWLRQFQRSPPWERANHKLFLSSCTIDYRCDDMRCRLSAHDCLVPTPASQNLDL